MTPQQDLLEQYLRTLRQQPDAAPPPGLDRELAAVARLLSRSSAKAPAGARNRVWQRALLAQRSNGKPPISPVKEPMMTTQVLARPARKSYTGLLVAAAALCIFSLALLMLAQRPGPTTETPINAALQADGSPTPTTTPTNTHTPTPIASFTPVPIVPQVDGQVSIPADLPVAADSTLQFIFPTAVPLSMTPVEILDITPYTFGAPDTQGQISSALRPEAPAIAYRFTADRDGLVIAELRSGDLALMGMTFSLMSADNSGGGGGGGGGGESRSQMLNFGVRAGDQVEILINAAMGDIRQPLPFTLRVILNDVIDLGVEPFESVSENRLDNFSSPMALYRFEAEAGRVVTFRASGEDGFDTSITLLDANLTPIGGDEDSGPGYDAEIYRFELPQTGIYYLLVRPGSLGYGRYRLEMSALERPSLDDGPQIVRINGPLPPELRFRAQPGETVTITLRLPEDSRDYAVESASLIIEQGDFPIATYDLQASMPLPASGIVLSGRVTASADAELTVRVIASSSLSAPSQQDFALEVSVERE